MSAAWEVDAALRPEGKAGALVRTPTGLASYYQRWAHTWEFQALLKARPAAGDPDLGQQFLDITGPACGPRPAGNPSSTTSRRCAAGSRTTSRSEHRDRELKLGRRWAAGRRVRGAVAAAGARPDRSGPAAARHADGAAVADPGRLRRPHRTARRWPPPTPSCAAPSTGCSCSGCAAPICCRRTAPTWSGWPAPDGYSASGSASAAEVFIAERVRHSGTVRRLHEKLFYRPLLHAVAAVGRVPTRCGCPPEAARARLAALGFLRAGRRAAPPGGADPRSQPPRRDPAALAAGAARLLLLQPRPGRRPARPTGRCPRRLPTPPGTCGCSATRGRWPSGWPPCSAGPG